MNSTIPCGRTECVYRAIEGMLKKMKEDIAKTQSIAHPEQIVVAKMYNIVAAQLAEACRKKFGIPLKNCIPGIAEHNEKVSMDTFILLSTLKDGIITEEYEKELFEMLKKMNPDLKQQVESDREKGLL
jgi:hypothetical protein